MPDEKPYKTHSKFDLMIGELNSRRHDVIETRATTVRNHTPLIGVQTFIVQTYRDKDEQTGGDWIMLEYVADGTTVQIPIPPVVADVIARQRDALTSRNRRASAKRTAQARKAAGILPGFMKGKKKRGRKAAKKPDDFIGKYSAPVD